MKPRFLLDEHLNPVIQEQLLKLNPNIEILCIGNEGVPPLGTLDPQILIWIGANEYILITQNRKSMPGHVVDHFAAGNSFPGILTIKPETSIGEIVNELALIWESSEADEYINTMQFIPF